MHFLSYLPKNNLLVFLFIIFSFKNIWALTLSGEAELGSAYNSNFGFSSEDQIAETKGVGEGKVAVFQNILDGSIDLSSHNFTLNYSASAKSAPQYHSYFSLRQFSDLEYLFEFNNFDLSIGISGESFSDYDDANSFAFRYAGYSLHSDLFSYQSSQFSGYVSARTTIYKSVDKESFSYLNGRQYLLESGEYLYPFTSYRHYFMVGGGVKFTDLNDFQNQDSSFMLNNQYLEYFARVKAKFKFNPLTFTFKTKFIRRGYFDKDKITDQDGNLIFKKRVDFTFVGHGEVKYVFSPSLSFDCFYQFTNNKSSIEEKSVINHSYIQHLTGLSVTYLFE